MRLRRGDAEEEREVLADLAAVARDLQLAVHAAGVVHEELAVERLPGGSSRGCVPASRASSGRSYRRPSGGEDVRRRACSRGSSRPARTRWPSTTRRTPSSGSFSSRPSAFRKRLKNSRSFEHARVGGPRRVSRSPLRARYSSSSTHEPHRPVRDEHAVVVVRRIAHRQHARRAGGRTSRAAGKFSRKFLSMRRVAAQVLRHARGEEAVAQPAGPLARRAVHEDVDGVLPERLDARRRRSG